MASICFRRVFVLVIMVRARRSTTGEGLVVLIHDFRYEYAQAR